jgi:hypothetical protein
MCYYIQSAAIFQDVFSYLFNSFAVWASMTGKRLDKPRPARTKTRRDGQRPSPAGATQAVRLRLIERRSALEKQGFA